MLIESEQIHEAVEQQRRFFQTGKTKEIEFRIEQIKRLRQAIAHREADLLKALQADLGKPTFEGVTAEMAYCQTEIDYALKHIKAWVKPQKVSTPLVLFPARSQILQEPLGVVLIISPWNYPLQLLISPLVGAIAAGNCAILKPSEIAPHTASAIAELIRETFAPEFVRVIEGDKEVNQKLFAEKFDHIFFTGSTRVGKIVMKAAAEQLTPVTLELGGKNPCIVDRDIQLATSARRITWGKFINAGQTCIAPDYLLVNREIKTPLLDAIKQCIKEFYGDDPATSPDYARIVSDAHFQRLSQLLERGNIVFGGQTKAAERYIAPTLIEGVTWEDPIMQEEIFGPILPVLEYEDLEEAIAAINARPKPLALYIFSNRKAVQQRVLQATSAGGVTINDTVIHFISPELPFGGVGASGIGAYHGKASFETFSHAKSVIKKPFFFDAKLRYPPYQGKLKLLRWLMEIG